MCKFCSIKCWFIFFNTLFLASGVALISIGALQYSTYSQMGTFAGSSLSKIAIVLIAFICILIVIIILEILTGAAFYIFRSRTALLQMNSAINAKARGVIYDYSLENRHSINRIQEKFGCCGADSYTDWSRSVGWENHKAVPDSCCVVKTEGCGQDTSKVHTKGCIWAIKLFLLKNLVWVGAVCIALGVTEVFGVLVGVCLCLKIKHKSYETLS
ncbi:CD63 antigen-like isoform X2 [Micropterus dolomieu]|uniref:CD63 antigen-like isoform X2 n=1 Tax=Micropterus dolomieu TaxID=147949 RepID=UPI001E8E56F3|nr:CD63 antigen-like isoform X2 [Micropterus dolomieu]